MMVLSDILLLNPMRALGLLKDKEFCISYFYLTGNYVSPTDKLIIKDLEERGCIRVFELSNDCYKFCNKNTNQNLAITELSSVYYAKQNNMPLVSNCKKITEFATNNGVIVYEPNIALKLINAEQDRINFLNNMMKIA